MLNKARKQGFGLIYVVLILSLVLILGTSVVTLAGNTYKQTYTEINYEQAYISARSGLDVIVEAFQAGSEKGKETRAQLLTFAKSIGLNETTDIGITLPTSDKMGVVEATGTCLEVDGPSGACTVIKVTVSATVEDRVATVSANLIGQFINEYKELENTITILGNEEDNPFIKDSLATIKDADGNILNDVNDKNKMYSILDTSDTEYFNPDGTTKPATDDAILEAVRDIYLIDSASSLPNCRVAPFINDSCKLTVSNNVTYNFNNKKPNTYQTMGEYASNYALIDFGTNIETIPIVKTKLLTISPNPELSLLYGLYVTVSPTNSKNVTLQFTADSAIKDMNDNIKESFLIIYLGSKPLKISFESTNNGEKFTYHGWVFAPNAPVTLSGHNQNTSVGFNTIQGGIISKSITINKNVNMQYGKPSPQLTQLFSGLKASNATVNRSMMWSVAYE